MIKTKQQSGDTAGSRRKISILSLIYTITIIITISPIVGYGLIPWIQNLLDIKLPSFTCMLITAIVFVIGALMAYIHKSIYEKESC